MPAGPEFKGWILRFGASFLPRDVLTPQSDGEQQQRSMDPPQPTPPAPPMKAQHRAHSCLRPKGTIQDPPVPRQTQLTPPHRGRPVFSAEKQQPGEKSTAARQQHITPDLAPAVFRTQLLFLIHTKERGNELLSPAPHP